MDMRQVIRGRSGPRFQEGFGLGEDLEDVVFPFGWPQKPGQMRGTASRAPAQHTTRSLCNCAVMATGTGAGICVPAKCLKQRV